MNAVAPQGANVRQYRTLKIEAAGSAFLQKRTPKIRITGKWLEAAGFKPGHRVEILLNQPGTMTVRFVEQTQGGMQ